MKKLNGSEKQVKWAEDIRKNILDGLNIMKNIFGLDVDSCIESVKNETSAKAFIDNRENYSKLLPIKVKGSKRGKVVEGGIISFVHSARGPESLAVRAGDDSWGEILLVRKIEEIIQK